MRFNAHINVELCSGLHVLKYLHLYIHKGPDKMMVTLRSMSNKETQQGEVNEITEYEDVRYIGSSEACWRLFAFPMHYSSHTVYRLAVHLPGQQSVYFDDDLNIEQIERFAETTLTAWFRANQLYPQGRELTYVEYPEYFTYDKVNRTWKPRQKSCKVIGRMYSATPRQGERYYLRMLLLRVAGATCYEDLRTLPDGTVCDTFQETCRRMGLLQDDSEWDTALTEAQRTVTPSHLRSLFVIILLFSNPADPLALWEKFKLSLSEDFFYHRRRNFPDGDINTCQKVCINMALQAIQKKLMLYSSKLENFHLPHVEYDILEDAGENLNVPFVI